MEKEEAIKEIKNASDEEVRYGDIEHHYEDVMKRVEAFEMAIEALEQEPCEDCISRQAVIDCFKKWQPYMATRLHEFENELFELPSVNPQKSDWIPVSERLPEDNELVLFSTKTDRVFEGRFFSDNTDRQLYSFCDRTFAWNNVVIAWMSLPEPYKAESEVKNESKRY